MAFVERDVSRDPQAAQEMVRRSGQQGVPVTVAGDDVIVGFDRPALERVAARARRAGQRTAPPGPRLGLAVKEVPEGGLLVGRVRAGSAGEQAGVRAGDRLLLLAGRPVRSVAELQQLTAGLPAGTGLPLLVRRDGADLELTLVA